MNPTFNARHERDVPIKLRTRLFVCLGIWLAGGIAFQLLLEPEGGTTTHLAPSEQRLQWLLFTPLMASVGLAQAITWPGWPSETAGFLAVVCFAALAALAAAISSRRAFIALSTVQAGMLGIAVFHFVRQSQLPTGG